MRKAITAQSVDFGMGTEIIHRAFGIHAEEALRAVSGEVERLEKLLSCFIPESEISKINNSAGIKCEKVSFDTYEVLSRAAQFSSCCQGLFDVTIGPLVNLWDYKNASEVPEEESISKVLPLVHYNDLILDSNEKTAGLRKVGQSIDLGGIGKGFASNMFLEMFRSYSITSAFTNIGGNVATLGAKPDGSLWRVGIRHPRQDNYLIGAVSVSDKSVVTSGDYQRYFFDSKGIRHHHILNPTTGYPARSSLLSVTIVADSATVADALSTILFVAGMETGLELIKKFSGAEAIFVDTNMQVYVTQELKDCFQSDEGISVKILE